MKLPQFKLRTIFVVVAVCAGIMAWRQWTMPWIKRRNDALNSINSYLSSRFPSVTTAKGFRDTRWQLPWNLMIWGEPNCVRYIYFCTDDVSGDDQDKIKELKELFPEADVAILTRAEWNNFSKIVVPP